MEGSDSGVQPGEGGDKELIGRRRKEPESRTRFQARRRGDLTVPENNVKAAGEPE